MPLQVKTITSLPLASLGWNTSPSTRTLMGLTSIRIAPLAASAVTAVELMSSAVNAPAAKDRNRFFILNCLLYVGFVFPRPNHTENSAIPQRCHEASSAANRASSAATVQFVLNCPRGPGPNCASARRSSSMSFFHSSGWCVLSLRSSPILWRGQHQQEAR